jgi:bifunctional DNA-binding transcriptional regulator/antitoxin component of YhaV-PrlF toxin-antitoxin module
MTLVLDQNGKFEIPEKFRHALHLEPGSQIQIQLEGETLILTNAKPPELKRIGKLLMWTGEVDSSLDDAVEKIRLERLIQVGES